MDGYRASRNGATPSNPLTTRSGRKSPVSAAIWIAAKRESFEWRRIWPTWRNRKTPLSAQGAVAAAAHPLVLVGRYERGDGLDQAAEQFAAAAFNAQDAVFVRDTRVAHGGLWSRVLSLGRACVAREGHVKKYDPGAPLNFKDADERIACGGGFVLVRSPARFHQACEIIERTGGRVGCL
jgi:hypothetical protein